MKEYKHGSYYIDEREDGKWLTVYCSNDRPIVTAEMQSLIDWDLWEEIYFAEGFVVPMSGLSYKSYAYIPLK